MNINDSINTYMNAVQCELDKEMPNTFKVEDMTVRMLDSQIPGFTNASAIVKFEFDDNRCLYLNLKYSNTEDILTADPSMLTWLAREWQVYDKSVYDITVSDLAQLTIGAYNQLCIAYSGFCSKRESMRLERVINTLTKLKN